MKIGTITTSSTLLCGSVRLVRLRVIARTQMSHYNLDRRNEIKKEKERENLSAHRHVTRACPFGGWLHRRESILLYKSLYLGLVEEKEETRPLGCPGHAIRHAVCRGEEGGGVEDTSGLEYAVHFLNSSLQPRPAVHSGACVHSI